MIVTSTRAGQDQWIQSHGMGQQRSPEKNNEVDHSPEPRQMKHGVRHRIEDAYQHDEVLADFLAALHRRPSRSALRGNGPESNGVGIKREIQHDRNSHRGNARRSVTKLDRKSRVEEPPKRGVMSSVEQEFLDGATDDDAVAISCLQHLSRAIPKLEPARGIRQSRSSRNPREPREQPRQQQQRKQQQPQQQQPQQYEQQVPQLEKMSSGASDTYSSAHSRRTRVPMACTRCKMAHTRCDTKRPCGRCIRRGVADSCVDAIPKRRGRKRSEEMEVSMERSIRPRLVMNESKNGEFAKDDYGDEGSPSSDSVTRSWSSRQSSPKNALTPSNSYSRQRVDSSGY